MKWTLAIACWLAVVGAGMRPASALAADPPELSGVVRGEDGAPLARARVVVAAIGRATVTDDAGRFALRGLPAGRHRVEVSLLGYAPTTAEVVLRPGDPPPPLAVTLSATPLALPGVEVTAAPGGASGAAARATSQLRGQALERRLSGSLAATLEAEPGMAVRYNGPAATAPMVRGLTGDRVLVLQDGQRVADLAGSADDHAVALDPLGAQRIEVVRGPASLLYGNNALGGVVNVITADIPEHVPARQEGVAALQSESAFPGASGTLRTTAPLAERWALALRGGARALGDVRIGRDPEIGRRLANTGQRSWNASAGLGYQGDGASGGVALRVYDFGYGLPLPPGEPALNLEGRAVAATARVDVRLPGETFPGLRVSGSVQDYRHREMEDGELEMAFGLTTRTAEVLLRQGAAGPFGEGAWGVSALLRGYAATGQEQLTAPADARGLGAFVFQAVPIGAAGASLELGGRADRWDVASRDDARFGPGVGRGFTALSGSAGFTVPVGEAVSLGTSVARSFRAPSVEEMFSNALHAGTAAFEVGDPGLAPEYSRGADAVLRVRTPRLNAQLAGYHNRVDGFIHFQARGDTVIGATAWPVLAYVQAGATLTGAEGSAEWVMARRWVGSVRGDLVRATREDGTPLPYIPAARLAGSLRWDSGPVNVGGGVRHAFRQERVGMPDEPPTAGYTLLDADAGVRLAHRRLIHSLTLRAENLTDRLYRDATSRVKDFAPNPGRNVSLLYRVLF